MLRGGLCHSFVINYLDIPDLADRSSVHTVRRMSGDAGSVSCRSWQLRCKRLRDEVREMRARLEEADGRAARWAQRAGMAETPLRTDAGASLPSSTCVEVVTCFR